MERKLPLLILTHNFPRFSGDFSGVFLGLLARRLLGHGIQPVVLAPHDRGAADYEENSGVRIYRFHYAKDEARENLAYRGNMHQLVLGSPAGMLRFKRFLTSFRRAAFDVIAKEDIRIIGGHWLVPSGFVMRAIGRNTSLPMILSSHGTDIQLICKYRGLPYRYFLGLFKRLKHWTVVSSFLKQQIQRMDSGMGRRLEVLPLPHDETVFFKDEKVRPQENLVVSVTRFTGQKRVDYLIKAFALLTQRVPAARLEIYGSGPMLPELERLVAAHGLSGQARIIAPVSQEELRGVYNRASIVVLNSVGEGFGLSLSEAMMCGTAVIGAASGGITDIIEHEQRGLLVEPDNSQSLCDAIVRLLGDNPLRSRLAQKGHEFACEEYASGPLAAKYARIVHETVEDAAPGRG